MIALVEKQHGDSFSVFRGIVLEKTTMPEYFTGLVV